MMLLLLWMALTSDEMYYLPEWAQSYYKLHGPSEIPVRADVHRIEERYELDFDDRGRILRRHRVVYRVNRQGGALDASRYAAPGGNDKGKLLRLRGWHVNARGEVDILDESRLVIAGLSQRGNLVDETVAFVSFARVATGSIVIFESLYREKSFMGPISMFPVLGKYPVDHFSVGFASGREPGRVIHTGLESWGITPRMINGELVLNKLPGLGEEAEQASFADLYPRVLVRFDRDGEDGPRYDSWDSFAAWYWTVFEAAAFEKGAPEPGPVDVDALRRVIEKVSERIVYRQVYLSHARGYVPDKGADVMRRAYGDCKDIVACTAHLASESAILVRPALANIVTGPFTTGDDPPSPSFNHLITAVPLAKSLDLPAEVAVDGKRYLLFDGTAPDTRFGYLPRGYEGRRVMICEPEGAVWVAIPEEALEPGDLRCDLTGTLSEAGELRGELTIAERGNAAGLRAIIEDTAEIRERVIRYQLELPPYLALEAKDARREPNGDTVQTWTVRWPGFTRQDADGFRLPDCIVPDLSVPVEPAGRRRRSPVIFEAIPEIRWHLELEGVSAWRPGEMHAGAESRFGRWQWRVTRDEALVIEHRFSRERVILDRRELRKGLEEWHAFDRGYARFRERGSLLYPGE